MAPPRRAAHGMCGDVAKQQELEILPTIAHFRADKPRFISYFPLERAWRRQQA